MKRVLVPVLAAGAMLMALATVASVASADSNSPYVRRRAIQQEVRIREGVRRGQLTRVERSRLRAAQLRALAAHRRMMADGRLSMRERVRLHRMLDRQNYRIYRMRHNGRSA